MKNWKLTHEDDRRLETPLPGLLDVLETLRVTDTVLDGDVVRLLDDGTIGHGVREGDTELDDVGTTGLEGKESVDSDIGSGVASREEGHEHAVRSAGNWEDAAEKPVWSLKSAGELEAAWRAYRSVHDHYLGDVALRERVGEPGALLKVYSRLVLVVSG